MRLKFGSEGRQMVVESVLSSATPIHSLPIPDLDDVPGVHRTQAFRDGRKVSGYPILWQELTFPSNLKAWCKIAAEFKPDEAVA